MLTSPIWQQRPAPRRCAGIDAVGRQRRAGEAVEHERIAGIAELELGAQHIHRQALEGCGKDVATDHQQHALGLRPDADEARDHASLGRAQRGQARLGRAEEGEVLGQLAVEEIGGLGALGEDHAEVRKGCYAIQNDWGHR
jgi:hypothetical protein